MVTSKEISNCLGDHPRHNILIYESTYKVYTLAIGEKSKCNVLLLVDIKMQRFAIRR